MRVPVDVPQPSRRLGKTVIRQGVAEAWRLLPVGSLLALLIAIPLFATPSGTDGVCTDERPAAIRELADALRDASGEWRENVVLPT